MPLSTFAGGRLVGVRHGTGRPWVLALHGWRRDHHDFDAVLDGLDAVAIDLPGFGAAAPPPEGWDTAGYARFVAPILEEMAPDPVVLGHSFGGRVAVRLAASDASIGALVLTGVPLVPALGATPRRPPRAVRVARRLRRYHLVGERRMELLRQRYGSDDYRAASGTMRQVLIKAVSEDGHYGDDLGRFNGPVELVWGSDDTAAPVAGARVAATLCADGRLVELQGVDHFTPQRASEALRDALLRHRPAA